MAIDKNRIAVPLIILAVAGYWYFSPYITVYQLQTAARASDAAAFNRHVDYPRLRDNVKQQLAAMTLEPSGAQPGFFNKLGLLVIDKMVNAFVQPEAVMLAMRQGVFKPQQQHAGVPDEPAQKPRWTSSRNGLNSFIVQLAADDGQTDGKLALVLDREGFADWKLTQIRFPADVRQP